MVLNSNAFVTAILTAFIGIYPYFYRRNELTRLFALSNLYLALWNISDLIYCQFLESLLKTIKYE